MTVGILALQGDFAAHAHALAAAGASAVAVRKPADLDSVDALILPGGESTAMLHAIVRDGLEQPLRSFLGAGRRGLGTCAGAILLARCVTHPAQWSFGALDIEIARNAYGTQRDSFTASLEGAAPFAGVPAVFIRAPRIVGVGPGVEVLGRVGCDPVLVRAGALWAATFHPELTDDGRVIERWLAAGAAR